MILDTSSIIAILFKEPGYEDLLQTVTEGDAAVGTATLNFGDCLSYAVARLADEPLLFAGDDFARTDVPQP